MTPKPTPQPRTPSPRETYYADPKRMDGDTSFDEWATPMVPRAMPDDAPNLLSSRCEDGLHRPVLDIDYPCRLVPSATPGHFHLYLDGHPGLAWPDYEALLRSLAKCNVIQHGYASASIERQQTVVRMEHAMKQAPPADAVPVAPIALCDAEQITRERGRPERRIACFRHLGHEGPHQFAVDVPPPVAAVIDPFDRF